MTGQPIPFDPRSLLREEAFVRRLARGLLFDDHEVDDVVQETWMAAMRNRPQGSERRSTRAFLSTVVRRKAADHARSSSRRRHRESLVAARTRPESAVFEAADDALAREELRTRVVEALRNLESPYREVVALRYLEDLEPVDIAERQGVNANTIRSQIHRGLKKIRERLDQEHGDRRSWCLAMIPLATPRAGVAQAAIGTAGLSIWAKLLAALLVATGAVLVWLPEGRRTDDEVPRLAAGDDTGPNSSADSTSGSNSGPVADGAPTRRVTTDAAGAPRTAGPVVSSGRLTGRLLDPDGVPMPGASVQFIALDGPRMFVDPSGLSGASALTDSAGRFESPPLPATADCALLADKGGALQQLVLVPQTIACGFATDLGDLYLEPRGTVEGVVLDGNGEPIGDAEVFATDLPSLALSAVPIQRFHPSSGALFLVPRLREDRPAQLADSIEMMLIRLGRDAIRDFESDEHQPLVLTGDPVLPIWDVLPIPRTRTGADGRFRLGSLPASPQTIVVTAAGHQSWSRGPVTVGERESKDLGSVTLRPGAELEGTVTDHAGNPVGGAELRVAPLGIVGFRGVTPVSEVQRTDARGMFHFDSLDRGRVLVLFRHGPGHQWSITGPESSDSVLALRLQPTIEHELKFAEGRSDRLLSVLARPTPPLGELTEMGLAESFRNLSFERLAEDTIRLTDLEEGTWTLRLEFADGLRLTEVVDLPRSEPTEVTVPDLHRTTLTVVDASNRPVPNADVMLRPANDPELQRVLASRYGLALWNDRLPVAIGRTDDSGRLVIDAIEDGTEIHVRSVSEGIGATVFRTGTEPRIEVQGQGHLVGRVVLRSGDALPTTGLRVSLRPIAIGREAQPLRAASGSATESVETIGELLDPDLTTAPLTSRVLRVDEAGRFEALGLPPGRYAIELVPGLPQTLSLLGLFEHAQRRSSVFASRAEPLASSQIEVLPGTTTEAEFGFDDGTAGLGGIRGRIVVNGRPMTGARIFLRENRPNAWGPVFESDPRAITDSNGEFEIQALEATTQGFGVQPAAHEDVVGQFEEVVVGGSTIRCEWSIAIGSITLRLLDPSGGPIPNVTVLLQPERPDGLHDAQWMEILNSAGYEQFRRVSDQDGVTNFEAIRAGEYEAICLSQEARSTRTKVFVQPGPSNTRLDLPVEPACGIRLRISDPAGLLANAQYDPARSLFARLRKAGDDRMSWQSGRVGFEQVWWLDDPGLYRVSARIGSRNVQLSVSEIQVERPTGFGVERVIDAEVTAYEDG